MNNHFEIHDVYLTSFLEMSGIEVDFRVAPTGRVVFLLPGKEGVRDLISEFNSNPQVPLLDYVQSLRKIRARMISMRA